MDYDRILDQAYCEFLMEERQRMKDSMPAMVTELQAKGKISNEFMDSYNIMKSHEQYNRDPLILNRQYADQILIHDTM